MLLSALTAWPIVARAARRRRGNGRGLDGRVRAVLTVTSSVYLLFIVTFTVALLEATEIEFGFFPALAVALALGGTAAVLAAGSVVGTVVALGRRSGSVAERTYAACVAIACVALAWQLHDWNLLGVRL